MIFVAGRQGATVFGIGIPEILIIALVALVFLNPKDLPDLFRNLGKGYRQIRRMREDFMKEVDGIKEGIKEGIKDSVNDGFDAGYQDSIQPGKAGPPPSSAKQPVTRSENQGPPDAIASKDGEHGEGI
jgi:Sec-independent protein translocase protein TatA